MQCALTHTNTNVLLIHHITCKTSKEGWTNNLYDQWDWKNKKRGYLYAFEFHKCIKIVVTWFRNSDDDRISISRIKSWLSLDYILQRRQNMCMENKLPHINICIGWIWLKSHMMIEYTLELIRQWYDKGNNKTRLF